MTPADRARAMADLRAIPRLTHERVTFLMSFAEVPLTKRLAEADRIYAEGEERMAALARAIVRGETHAH